MISLKPFAIFVKKIKKKISGMEIKNSSIFKSSSMYIITAEILLFACIKILIFSNIKW